MTRPEGDTERIAVLAPSANDGPVTVRLLADARFEAVLARDVAQLCRILREGAAAAIVAEEALGSEASAAPLLAFLREQEPWSDLPIILFAGRRADGTPARAPSLEALAPLGNVTVLDRPVQIVTLVSAAAAAVRARRRQYAARAALLERARAEEALREADRRKTEFLGVLSHELRNPLAPIRNSIYLLERAPPDSGPARRARDVISRQAGHLARLVDDLLDVTRISRGKIALQRSVVDVSEVVRRTCDDHAALFAERGIELRVEAAAPAWVDADSTRIAQVVGNLLQNAVKFSRPGDTVTVQLATVGSVVELRVRDEGIGIDPALLPQLFQPFVQAESGLSRTLGGLGLGLALVKGIVELHGGAVQATSPGVGGGAEVLVTLPSARPGRAPAAVPGPARGATRAGCDVLVIEDNADAARSVADLLELEGHRVHVAPDGRSGIETARAVRPDVILCDLGLPDIDGFEVARTIRDDAALRGTRLVAVSGYGQREDRERSRAAGFDDHLLKPAAPDALLGAVRCGPSSGDPGAAA